MIRLMKSGNGEPVYVSPELIVSAEIVNGATMLNVRSDRIFVTESPEEVARKVLEWKLAMIDYHHDIPSVKMKAMMELAKLAGTVEEETNHDAG